MNIQLGFFYLFAATLLFSAFRVITAKNPVHAVLFLILAFSQAAALWLMLQAEFLGIALVVVYLGAVMVLFLFVVMMLDIRIESLRQNFWHHFPIAAAIGVLVVLEMGVVLMTGFGKIESPHQIVSKIENYSNTSALGELLYTEYLYPVEVAAIILLVAMIAAIALTLRKRKDTKVVHVADQVRVKPSDRVVLVEVQASSDSDVEQQTSFVINSGGAK